MSIFRDGGCKFSWKVSEAQDDTEHNEVQNLDPTGLAYIQAFQIVD